MDQENPTAGDGGASITDRLERFLAAEDAPQTPPQDQPQADPKAQAAPTDKPDDGDQGQDEGPQVTTADLAKLLGVDESALDVDEDGTIKVKTKIDGTEGAAKFKDLLAAHQKQGHADKVMREAAEKEKAAQARLQEVEQQAQAKLQHVEALANAAGNELAREFQGINWEALRQSDPGQYAALRADFQERGNRLQGILNHVQQQRDAQKQQFDKQLESRRGEEAARLLELVPAWKTGDAFVKDSEAIHKLATERGVPQQLLDAIAKGPLVNAGLISMMRDAVEFQRMQQSKPEIENRVRQAPKLVKPGQAAQDTQTTKLQSLKQNVQKSGGKGNALETYLINAGLV